MHPKIHEIANELRRYFIYQQDASSEYSIFLCGAARTNPSSIRDDVRAKIEGKKSKFTYRVYYPEDLFVELLLGHQRKSLLDLENLLATNVSSVAIITESPGALVELGAFSNHEALCQKLIVFLEARFRTHKSFINLGPVRRLKRRPTSSVHFVDFSSSSAARIAETICDETRKISEVLPAAKELTNPITAARFYLALVHTLDPIPIEQVLEIANELSASDPEIENVATLAITTLLTEGKISSSIKGLRTTASGSNALLNESLTAKKIEETKRFLGLMRARALNIVLRNT